MGVITYQTIFYKYGRLILNEFVKNNFIYRVTFKLYLPGQVMRNKSWLVSK